MIFGGCSEPRFNIAIVRFNGFFFGMQLLGIVGVTVFAITIRFVIVNQI